MSDPILHADAAQRALDEFLTPAFEHVVAAYTARLAEIAAAEPWASDKIIKLAMAIRVAREVRGQIEGVVSAGELAANAKAHADKIAQIPFEQRKYMGVGLHATGGR
jgi:hypothetical protein